VVVIGEIVSLKQLLSLSPVQLRRGEESNQREILYSKFRVAKEKRDLKKKLYMLEGAKSIGAGAATIALAGAAIGFDFYSVMGLLDPNLLFQLSHPAGSLVDFGASPIIGDVSYFQPMLPVDEASGGGKNSLFAVSESSAASITKFFKKVTLRVAEGCSTAVCNCIINEVLDDD